MPLRPTGKSADEHGDRNEVEKDRQQILDQVALGRWPAFPPAHTGAGPTAELPARMFAATALSQPPETTAADDNALARLRAGEATSLVLLTATALGLTSRPITEPLEIPQTRKAVHAAITFELHEFPQIMLRSEGHR
jgi:hypothetical protein